MIKSKFLQKKIKIIYLSFVEQKEKEKESTKSKGKYVLFKENSEQK